MAIYFQNQKATTEAKNLFSSLLGKLRAQEIISDYTFIDDSIVAIDDHQYHGMSALRRAAARVGADAILIISDASESETYNNLLGATYLFIAPYFLIPGTVADSISISRASLWDVRNQHLYLTASAEGQAKETRPGIFIESDRVAKKPRIKSLKSLSDKLSIEFEKISLK